ncbi:MAG: DUF1573 domain-containing protein [Vicingus serpentipes]|nr:DUF1573 domain-containing protein [Vicingus serpentipes]
MKSYLFNLSLSLLLLVASFSFGQNPNDIHFERLVHKFKKVDEGKQLEFNYSFTYLGQEPLTLTVEKIDCSCTEVILHEEKIEAGKTYAIIIKFDTNNKIGYQEREVILNYNSPSNETTIEKKLIFKGVVKASAATKAAYKKSKQE